MDERGQAKNYYSGDPAYNHTYPIKPKVIMDLVLLAYKILISCAAVSFCF